MRISSASAAARREANDTSPRRQFQDPRKLNATRVRAVQSAVVRLEPARRGAPTRAATSFRLPPPKPPSTLDSTSPAAFANTPSPPSFASADSRPPLPPSPTRDIPRPATNHERALRVPNRSAAPVLPPSQPLGRSAAFGTASENPDQIRTRVAWSSHAPNDLTLQHSS